MKTKQSISLKDLFEQKSLRIQLLSRSLLVLAALLALIGLMQYVFMKDVMYRGKAVSLQSQIMTFPPEIWNMMTSNYDKNKQGLRFFIPEVNVAFIDTKGNYSILSEGRYKIIPPRLDSQEYQNLLNNPTKREEQSEKPDRTKNHGPNYIISNNGGAEQLVVLEPLVSRRTNELVGIIQISTLTAPLKELLIGQLITFISLSLIALLIGLLAFLPVLRKTLDPLSNMVNTAEQIDAGNLDSRFPSSQGQMEIDRLAESFNGMLERLEISFTAERETKEKMRRFIADASHELRTPLTSIQGFLEVLLRVAASQPEQLDKSLRSMHSESQRLNKLVHDLLLLSKLDRTPHVELKEGYLDEVVRDMESQLHILAGPRHLELYIEEGLKCEYDEDQMKQVILNLFHNAVQYTDPENGNIQLLLCKMELAVQLSIQDNGQGISADHLPHIFDRFYRSDSSRTRKYGGAGLGLAITKSIIDAHGGSIEVDSREGKGTKFTISLPKS
ncbi:MAG: ATP-binding protein [Syntrophomonadaceae bacterium]|nr:ATP-binding protein [Syntrophomonadaceae bacterium]